jgi:hypothetical protein
MITEDFESHSIEILLKDRRRFRRYIQTYVKGYTHNCLTWDDLIVDFWKCAPYSAVPLPEAKLQ